MSRRRSSKARPSPVGPTVEAPPALPGVATDRRVIDVAAAITALLCLALAWFSRGNLNVDGVAYLDLAARIRSGDWAALVQGYWSPAYPVLLAVVMSFGAGEGAAAVTAAHVLNGIIAISLVWILWRAFRPRGDTSLALSALVAFLVASARTPRLDAVTPDLLLMLVFVLIGLELLREDGWRGSRIGLLAGLSFLVKTSTWPWLIVLSVVSGALLWRNPARRREWMRAVPLALAAPLLWGTLLSVQAGKPTLGDTGPLGACWYLRGCDGRSPDTHRGGHVAYQQWRLSDTLTVQAAVFEPAEWTYAPWSDVSAWQRGITSQRRDRIDPFSWGLYAYTQLGFVLRYWFPWLAVLVIAPLLFGRKRQPGQRLPVSGPAGFAMLAAVLGVLQFVAVHVEPRLIGPYLMLGAVGFLWWRADAVPRRWEWIAAMVAFVIAIAVGVAHLGDQKKVTAGSIARAAEVSKQRPPGEPPHRVAVVGTAFNLVPDLYRTESVAVVQLMVPDPDAVTRWPIPAQLALLDHFREAGATTIWFSHGKAGYRMVVPPSAAQSAATRAALEAVGGITRQ